MSQVNLAEQKGLGYFFSPARRRSEPGFSRLDVVLRDLPTEQHFDPTHLRLILAQEKGPEYSQIEHPWAGDKTLRVCAGPLDLVDRINKRVEVFSFGGEAAIEAGEESTLVIITSPAPILIMRAQDSVPCLLAQEAEILLAERSAALEASHGMFESRLAAAEPLALYRSFLCAIQTRLESLPPTGNELWQHFRHIIQEESRLLQETHPGEPCQPLEMIL